MDLSVIIPHYNRGALLERCLASIPAGASELSYEVIVVDNGSRDGSLAMVQQHFPSVILLRNDKNEGFSRATNRGLRIAKGGHLLCLNHDTALVPNSLNALVSFMGKHPEAGVVGGKILNLDGTVQPSARAFPGLATAFFNRGSFLTRLFPRNPFTTRYLLTDWNHGTVREVDWVSGSFFLIRRELLETVGLFDERFFLYCEDVDYCRRAKEANYRVFYVPDGQMLHETGYSEFRFMTLFYHHQSMYRFYKKYHSRGRLWDAGVLAGITARFGIGVGFWAIRKLMKGAHGFPA
ncbi:MAG: glycosyltransferase family 2 protein [Candidatus Omnitrophota bacterium]